jgi:hypothetical protein
VVENVLLELPNIVSRGSTKAPQLRITKKIRTHISRRVRGLKELSGLIIDTISPL